MTPAPDLDLERLVIGQPDLFEQDDAIRGLVFGFAISSVLWLAIGWAVERVATWWLA